MLPDFVKLKTDLANDLTQKLYSKSLEKAKASALMRNTIIFEGDAAYTLHQEEQTPTIFNTSSSEFRISMEEFEKISLAEVVTRMEKAFDEVISDRETKIIEILEKSEGNKIRVGKGDMTPELLLQLIEEIDIDFDSDGNPFLPSIITSPVGYANLMKTVGSTSQLEYSAKKEQILKKKKEEWRERENNRKLVG